MTPAQSLSSEKNVIGTGSKILNFLASFYPFLIFIVLALGYIFLIRPEVQNLRGLRLLKQAAQNEAPLRSQEIQKLQQVKSALKDISLDDLEAVEDLAPANEDAPRLFVVLDTAAQRAGVSLSTIEVTREEAAKGTAGSRTLSVGLSVRTIDYQRLKSFLNTLASSRRLLDAVSVQFSPRALTASIRLLAYTSD